MRTDHLDPRLLEGARERGRRAAAAYDALLRRGEAKERRQLLAGTAEGDDEPFAPELDASVSRTQRATLARMQAEIDHLRRFERAVVHSRVWRTAQWLRRLLGRAW